MTINQILATPDRRDPVFLLEVQQGDVYYRYTTNSDSDDVYLNNRFRRRPMSVTKLGGSVSESISDCTITLPNDDDIVKIFDSFLPVEPVSCEIRYYERNDPDHEVRIVKAGQITTAVDKDDDTSELKIRPLYEAFNRVVPWQQQQAACPLMLYGVQCQANPVLFRKTAVGLIEITKEYLQAADFVTPSDATYFKAGYVKCRRTREVRFVINQDAAGRIFISYPFDYALVGDTYDAYAGCMRTGDICQEKFNNKIHFMGFEFIPERNMFRTGLK